MIFGLNRGELILVVFIFGLIYVAGLLPKIAARLGGRTSETGSSNSKGE